MSEINLRGKRLFATGLRIGECRFVVAALTKRTLKSACDRVLSEYCVDLDRFQEIMIVPFKKARKP